MKNNPYELFTIASKRWDSCPALKNHAISKAKTEVENGRQFSCQWLFEDVRRCEYTGNDGELFKVNNTLIPCYARLLIRDYPEAKSFMVTRRSRFDEFFEMR